MKSYRKELWFEVPGRRAFINITSDVQQCIDESGVKDGLVLVNTIQIDTIYQLLVDKGFFTEAEFLEKMKEIRAGYQRRGNA